MWDRLEKKVKQNWSRNEKVRTIFLTRQKSDHIWSSKEKLVNIFNAKRDTYLLFKLLLQYRVTLEHLNIDLIGKCSNHNLQIDVIRWCEIANFLVGIG